MTDRMERLTHDEQVELITGNICDARLKARPDWSAKQFNSDRDEVREFVRSTHRMGWTWNNSPWELDATMAMMAYDLFNLRSLDKKVSDMQEGFALLIADMNGHMEKYEQEINNLRAMIVAQERNK